MNLEPVDMNRLSAQLESDCKFLQQFGLMDYSLYMVIEKISGKLDNRRYQ